MLLKNRHTGQLVSGTGHITILCDQKTHLFLVHWYLGILGEQKISWAKGSTHLSLGDHQQLPVTVVPVLLKVAGRSREDRSSCLCPLFISLPAQNKEAHRAQHTVMGGECPQTAHTEITEGNYSNVAALWCQTWTSSSTVTHFHRGPPCILLMTFLPHYSKLRELWEAGA